MTSTMDMAGHPDVAEISDLAEGLLSPSRTADVRRHLDECELCADVHASLEEIRDLLGTLPEPPRMPAEVASRIDAALAAEALLSATAPDAVKTTADASAASTADSDDEAHVSRETSAPADRPAGHAQASTGPGRKNGPRRVRRRAVVLGAAFAAAAVGLGSVLLSSLLNGSSPGPSAQGPKTTAADTFSEGKLETQVADLLAAKQAPERGTQSPDDFGIEGGTQKPRVFKAPTVPDCVRQGIGRTDAALAVENGTFMGTDALLVVLPEASDSTRVTAYIVDATCVTQPSSTKAKVLLKHTYALS